MKARSILLAMSVFLVVSVFAATPKWDESPYEIYSNGESLSAVLRNFAASYDMPVTISPSLRATVNGRFKGDSPSQFLFVLGKSFDFEWYYDGSTLHFFRGDEIVNRIITLSNIKTYQLRNAVKKVGIYDERFGWREVPDKGLVYVSGPSVMIDMIQDTANVLESRVTKKSTKEEYTLKMFELKYATAADRSQTYRGSIIRIPGLASTLRSTLTKKSGGLAYSNSSGPIGILDGRQNAQESAVVSPSGSQAWIEADNRTNSILVYDRIDRMPMYQALIRNLDQPSEQVEVSVSVITVNNNNLNQLGVSWQGRDSSLGEIGYNGVGENLSAGANQMSILAGPGTTLSTVLDSGADFFISKVNALAQDGEAQIVSRPSIVTSEHMEAILDDTTTFHVRLEGNQDVDLYPVNVGSVLRVTPHIQRGDGSQAINLEVTIEDGQQTNAQVDGIPVIKSSTINTQTVVGIGQSLLIGGFIQDTETSSMSGLPVLRKVPIFGALFRSQSQSRQKMVKLFLLTPRLITDQIARTGIAKDGKKITGYAFKVGSARKEVARLIREYYDARGFRTRLSVDKNKKRNLYVVYIGNYARCEDTQRVSEAFPAEFQNEANVVASCSPLTE